MLSSLIVLNSHPKKLLITKILILFLMMSYIFMAYGALLVLMGVAFAVTYKKLAMGTEEEPAP